MIRRGLAAVMVVALAASVASGATVRLHRTAEVAAAAVKLGDVASLDDCPDGLKSVLRDMVVADSPAGRVMLRLKLTDVRRKLIENGVNMTEIALEGSSEIEVTRKRSERAAGRSGALGERVRREVLREASRTLEVPRDELEINALRFEAFGIPQDALVTVKPVGEVKFPGTVTFEAVATVNETEAGRFVVSAELEGVRRVVVARRTLGAGTTLREHDVELARVDGATAPTDALDKTTLVLGERLAKSVSAGEPVTTDCLAKPVLINRGDVCRMTIRGRGFHITGDVRAREKGSMGDAIGMESLKDRKRFSAVVTGRREVEVRLAKEEN